MAAEISTGDHCSEQPLALHDLPLTRMESVARKLYGAWVSRLIVTKQVKAEPSFPQMSPGRP